MASGLPEGKGRQRQLSLVEILPPLPALEGDVIPGKEPGTLPTESTGASGAGRLVCGRSSR